MYGFLLCPEELSQPGRAARLRGKEWRARSQSWGVARQAPSSCSSLSSAACLSLTLTLTLTLTLMSLTTFPRALPTAFGTFSRYVLPVYADYSILPHTEFEAEAKVAARGITSSDR